MSDLCGRLHGRREAFARFYIESPTATAAAIAAGYSARSAGNQACRLMALPVVRQRIDELRRQRKEMQDAPDIMFARGCASRVDFELARGRPDIAYKFVELYLASLTPVSSSGTE